MFRNFFISINGKMEQPKNEENENKNDNSIWNKVMIFYNKNKNELIVVLFLLIVYNFICSKSMSYQYLNKNKQFGGLGEELAQMSQGQDGKEKAKSFAKKFKGVNVLQKMLGWMLSLVQSLMTFAGLVLVLAVLPGLPIFIFMLILFFILRARVAVLKAY
jgi:Flp pilus assembly protein TadB